MSFRTLLPFQHWLFQQWSGRHLAESWRPPKRSFNEAEDVYHHVSPLYKNNFSLLVNSCSSTRHHVLAQITDHPNIYDSSAAEQDASYRPASLIIIWQQSFQSVSYLQYKHHASVSLCRSQTSANQSYLRAQNRFYSYIFSYTLLLLWSLNGTYGHCPKVLLTLPTSAMEWFFCTQCERPRCRKITFTFASASSTFCEDRPESLLSQNDPWQYQL